MDHRFGILLNGDCFDGKQTKQLLDLVIVIIHLSIQSIYRILLSFELLRKLTVMRVGNLGRSTRWIPMHIYTHRLWSWGMSISRAMSIGLREIRRGAHRVLLQGTRSTGQAMVMVWRGDLGEGEWTKVIQNQRVHHPGHLLESTIGTASTSVRLSILMCMSMWMMDRGRLRRWLRLRMRRQRLMRGR